MNLELEGRAVLVTGGSKGIGLACARAFIDEGAQVAIVSRDRANLDAATAQLPNVKTIVADLTRAEDAARMAQEAERALGPIDVLVNSAGAAKRYPLNELNAQAWHAAMDALLRSMRSRRRGVVVNIIGTGGKVATPIHLPGGAANSALMLASVGLASIYGKFGVRINAINPGATMTGRIKEALELEAKAKGVAVDKVLEDGQSRVPLGRYADPADIARVALFLASDLAAYVTGAIIPMDGGLNPII